MPLSRHCVHSPSPLNKFEIASGPDKSSHLTTLNLTSGSPKASATKSSTPPISSTPTVVSGSRWCAWPYPYRPCPARELESKRTVDVSKNRHIILLEPDLVLISRFSSRLCCSFCLPPSPLQQAIIGIHYSLSAADILLITVSYRCFARPIPSPLADPRRSSLSMPG